MMSTDTVRWKQLASKALSKQKSLTNHYYTEEIPPYRTRKRISEAISSWDRELKRAELHQLTLFGQERQQDGSY